MGLPLASKPEIRNAYWPLSSALFTAVRAGLMVKAIDCVAVAPSVSFACTTMPVNGLPTLVVDVPEITPVVAFSVRPAGSALLPAANDQV